MSDDDAVNHPLQTRQNVRKNRLNHLRTHQTVIFSSSSCIATQSVDAQKLRQGVALCPFPFKIIYYFIQVLSIFTASQNI
jgi:hypothetical protein